MKTDIKTDLMTVKYFREFHSRPYAFENIVEIQDLEIILHQDQDIPEIDKMNYALEIIEKEEKPDKVII